MGQVLRAEAYRFGALHSFGNARYMLMQQYNFPDKYSNKDKIECADSDRIYSWDYQHACDVHNKYRGLPGDMGMESWLHQGKPEEVMAFIKELLKADPNVEWTGFRVLGTVNMSNGYTVWSYELFAKHPESNTAVFTGPNAPNVKGNESMFLKRKDGYYYSPLDYLDYKERQAYGEPW